MLNIVVLSPFLLGNSATSGGGVGALGFLKSFASRHRVHMIALDEGRDSAETKRAVQDMEEWAASVRVVHLPMTLPRRITAKLLQMFFIPNSAVRVSAAAIREACHATLANGPIDLAVIQFPQMAQYATEFGDIPKVMDVQDAYSVSAFRDYAASDSLPLLVRYRAFRNWLSWVGYERRYYRMFEHLFVVSEQDGYGLKVFNATLKTTVLPRVMSMGPGSGVSENPEFHIGFIGSFIHKPNLLGLEFLFEQMVPELLKAVPDLRVLVAGKNPPKELVDRAPACVSFAGFVPAAEDFYRQIRIVVAPLRTGGGVKIKVVEGLLSGLPVVTTSIGAEGVGLVSGANAMIADQPADFVGAIVTLLDDPELRIKIGTAGQVHAMTLNSTDVHSQLVESVFATLCRKV